ncbi:AraC family transcriptional regulator [Streptoalloteichus hindustanus]|uniref:Transcriptional regulator, AraC family n=1 Tax=Streptoalloteichus hindustanus TaxID=2017 RepID=A0A1M4XXC4_STRHI|nr:AraC family transcriptional regulator [Streptoalloteichus hindustanus]SHE98207.1 transcriptional regulator, AraC family [Streptoalloteichus hindustanus]
MDTLTDLLAGVRARGALVTRTVTSPSWSVRFASGAQLTLITALAGRAWLVPAHAGPVPVEPGDVAVLRGPAPYTVADDPLTPPDQVITRDDYCARTRSAVASAEVSLPVRTCGVAETGPALLLSGAYSGGAGISDRLLNALPDVLVLSAADHRCPWLDAVADEVVRDRPGQQAVLDRLLDLMLVSTLRAWFDRPGTRAPAWYRPISDQAVDTALRLLHENPAHAWTVAGLAAKVGISRAALARRFAAEIGEPPMAYLTDWRLALAADLLRETDATVDSIARKVGYSTAFALSVAFKRRRGMTPTEHRVAARPDSAR